MNKRNVLNRSRTDNKPSHIIQIFTFSQKNKFFIYKKKKNKNKRF